MKQFFLWSGLRDIEEVGDDEGVPIAHYGEVTYAQALAALKAKQHGDWTLWLREGFECVLLATSVQRGGSRLVMEINENIPKETDMEMADMQVPFGQHQLDYLDDDTLLQMSEAVQKYAMARRRAHVLGVEDSFIAVVIGDRRQGLGYSIKGIAMVPRDEKLQENMKLISDTLDKGTFDCTAAVELQHRGIALLPFFAVEKDNPCTFIAFNPHKFGAVRPGDSGRWASRYPFTLDGSIPPEHRQERNREKNRLFVERYGVQGDVHAAFMRQAEFHNSMSRGELDAQAASRRAMFQGSMSSGQPSVQNIPKDKESTLDVLLDKFTPKAKGWPATANLDCAVETLTKHEFRDDQVFLCQNCGQQYVYGEAKKKLTEGRAGAKYNPLCFCGESCGDKYLAKRGTCNPPVGAEIPLGEPMMCNLMEDADFEAVVAKAEEEFKATGRAVVHDWPITSPGYPHTKGFVTPDWDGTGNTIHEEIRGAVLHLLSRREKEARTIAKQSSAKVALVEAVKRRIVGPVARRIVNAMVGMTVEGAMTFPNGVHVEAPKAGYVWVVEKDEEGAYLVEKLDIS